jgi:CMP/dCMP kinase
VRVKAGPSVIAIDGAAGSGKSTLGKGIALAVGLPYVNTGMMYRALTAAALKARLSIDDERSLVELTRDLRFTLSSGRPPVLEVEGWPAESLVTPEVEVAVSAVARHPGVRTLMRAQQRAIGDAHGAVMEGRDIGSVVFSDAPVKLYLEAQPGARGERRAEERPTPTDGGTTSVEDALHRRDASDARTVPHEPAPGAIVIDTTHLDVGETLAAALRAIDRRAPGRFR